MGKGSINDKIDEWTAQFGRLQKWKDVGTWDRITRIDQSRSTTDGLPTGAGRLPDHLELGLGVVNQSKLNLADLSDLPMSVADVEGAFRGEDTKWACRSC